MWKALVLILLLPLTSRCQIIIRGFGHFTVINGGAPSPPIDTAYEYLLPGTRINAQYTPSIHNFYINNVNNDIFIKLFGTNNGDTGNIKLNLVTGAENVYLNGLTLFIKPAIPGILIIHYSKMFNLLTFN